MQDEYIKKNRNIILWGFYWIKRFYKVFEARHWHRSLCLSNLNTDTLTMKWKAYLPEDMEVAEGEEAIIHQMKRKRKIDRYEI